MGRDKFSLGGRKDLSDISDIPIMTISKNALHLVTQYPHTQTHINIDTDRHRTKVL